MSHADVRPKEYNLLGEATTPGSLAICRIMELFAEMSAHPAELHPAVGPGGSTFVRGPVISGERASVFYYAPERRVGREREV